MKIAINKCGTNVADSGGWHWHKCGKPAKVTVEGSHYCGVHDPERRARIVAAKEAKIAKCSKCGVRKSVPHYKYCPYCGEKY